MELLNINLKYITMSFLSERASRNDNEDGNDHDYMTMMEINDKNVHSAADGFY